MGSSNDLALAEKTSVIRSLAAAGYVLVPLCSPTIPHEHVYGGKARLCKPTNMGKVPPKFGWQRTKLHQYAPEALAAGENYGVVLQSHDLVIDIDPRNFTPGDKPYSRLLTDLGVSISSFTVKTGSGGFHIYLRLLGEGVEVVNDLPKYPGVEFKSAGQQVAGPGSFHHLAQRHYVVHSGSPDKIQDAPPELIALISTAGRPAADPAVPGRLVDDLQTRTRFADYLREAPLSIKGAHGDETAFKVAAHGRDLGLPQQTTLELMLEFWNPRCTPNWVPENLQVKVFNAYKYGKGTVGQDHPADDFKAAEPSEVSLTDTPTVSWVLGPNNRVVKCFRNLLNYFWDPTGGLKGVFAYNEFSVRAEFAHPAPWHRGKLPICRGVTDHDLHMLKGFLAQRHKYEVALAEIESAIANAADTQKFHPVREYLSGLKWDGEKRLDTWLAKYLGARDEGAPEYLAAAGRKVLCAAVMRVLRPGAVFDHVLVLEGPQDLGKSSVVKILGGEWASDAPVDPHSRDTVDALQGRWIVEMAELEVFRKADEDALKAFITRPTDRVRLAYGRATGEYPRQCIFIATKNPRADSTYLKDETGNRRWWPVYCDGVPNSRSGLRQVDFDGLKLVKDQLFAEATHLMTQEKPREPLSMHTPELKRQAKSIVDRRLAKHDWTESIATWLSLQQSREETRLRFVTTLQVYKSALQGDDRSFGRREAQGIASVMRDLGWEKCHGRVEGTLHNGWRPALGEIPPAPAPAAEKKLWATML